jgi:hypothetical protein
MGTQLRQWAIRLLAAVALPVMLTLGLGVAANAQPVLASHVTSSTGHPINHRDWEVYGPFPSLRECFRAERVFRGRDSHCVSEYRPHHMDLVWYLYVQRGRMYPRPVRKQM